MGSRQRSIGIACMLAVVAGCAAAGAIPHRVFVLENGLRLVVHEDRKAPIVAVQVAYHVGSKNERPGRTGFAHLFEHLMFNGSEHFDDDYFKALERVGATGINGTTNEDRTHYFQTVPREALDTALWMESDRMGHFLGALTQERLEEQRGVVLNEKRQGDNQPYRIAWRLITRHAWPWGHPYSWEVIGSEEDLAAASLQDVRAWFRDFYGAANAVLVVAGDVSAEEALQKVRHAFGDIPPGPPVARPVVDVVRRTGARRMRVQDRVPQARLYKVWTIPQYGTTEGNRLTLAAEALAAGKSSRLYKRLVYDAQLATEVHAWADLREIAGQFGVVITVRPGVSLAEAERAADEEIARFLREGPTRRELERIQARIEADFIRQSEQVGGKADMLIRDLLFTGDAAYHEKRMREWREATPRQVVETARGWLSDGAFILEVEPFPAYRVATAGADRSALPLPSELPEAAFPAVRRATLSNGLRVVLVERHETPLVLCTLSVGAGFAADACAQRGTATLMADLLDEGTRHLSALELGRELERLGAALSTGCAPDATLVSLNTLSRHLDRALDLYAEVILHPAFPEEDFQRLRHQRLAQIRREKANPRGVAMRVMPRLLYGERHAYGQGFSGSGEEESVAGLTRDDLERFYRQEFKPNRATLVVAGDVTLEALLPRLERRFGSWKPGEVPDRSVAEARPALRPSVWLIDRPAAPQTLIVAGGIAPPKRHPLDPAIEALNTLLGGAFTSRVNMNLREEKHWSYGARTYLTEVCGPRAFLCIAPIQTDRVADAMRELDREFRGITGTNPPTAEELRKAVAHHTLQLAGRWETLGAVVGALEQVVRFDLPEEYYSMYAGTMRALTLPEVTRAAAEVIRPESLVWLVVGDRTQVEEPLRRLDWGPVNVLDADGKPVNGTVGSVSR